MSDVEGHYHQRQRERSDRDAEAGGVLLAAFTPRNKTDMVGGIGAFFRFQFAMIHWFAGIARRRKARKESIESND